MGAGGGEAFTRGKKKVQLRPLLVLRGCVEADKEKLAAGEMNTYSGEPPPPQGAQTALSAPQQTKQTPVIENDCILL